MPKEGNFYVYEKRKDGSFRDLKKSLFVGQCASEDILMKRKFVHEV